MGIVVYSAVAYIEYERAIKPPPSAAILATRRLHSSTETPQPWFVEATALAGGVTVFTALLGIMAGCYPNVWTLNTYSFSLSGLITGRLCACERVICIPLSWSSPAGQDNLVCFLLFSLTSRGRHGPQTHLGSMTRYGSHGVYPSCTPCTFPTYATYPHRPRPRHGSSGTMSSASGSASHCSPVRSLRWLSPVR